MDLFQLWTPLLTKYRQSYSSVSMICESTRLTKSSNDWLKFGKAAIQQLSEEYDFISVFCQVVQKH